MEGGVMSYTAADHKGANETLCPWNIFNSKAAYLTIFIIISYIGNNVVFQLFYLQKQRAALKNSFTKNCT